MEKLAVLFAWLPALVWAQSTHDVEACTPMERSLRR